MRRRRARRITVWILALSLATFIAGCGQGDERGTADQQGKIKVSFLTMQLRPTFDDFFLPLIAEFEQAHPGVSVEWLDYPFESYETKLMTSFMAKNAPDVINLPSDSIHNFARGNFLKPLDGVVPQDTVEKYLPNMINQGCTYDGRLYALPWYVAGAVTFYNTRILKEAGIEGLPDNYNEFPELLRTIKEKTGKFGYFPLYTEGGTLRLYLVEAGVPVLNEEGTRAAFNTPRAVEVLRFWTDLYRNKLVPDEAITAMHRRPIEYFKTGNVAMFESGPQFLRQVKSDAPEVYAVTDIGPDIIWEDTKSNILTLQTVALSNQTQHPELAAELAAFLTNSKNQLAFCKEVVILPSTIEALNDPYFTQAEDTPEGKARRLSAEQARTGILLPIPEQDKKLFQIFDDVVEQVCLGDLTAEQALDKAEQQWNEILAE